MTDLRLLDILLEIQLTHLALSMCGLGSVLIFSAHSDIGTLTCRTTFRSANGWQMGAPSPGRGSGNLSLAFTCFQRIVWCCLGSCNI